MTWDPNAKAAAFVTYMDPVVNLFSNNVNAMVRGAMNKAVDQNLQTAIAMHDALRLMGISYVSNPLTPYEVVSKNKLAVDTLKFPRDTLAYRSGDCSDLSILYAALLESVQIETAFVTIPGHIFIAFALTAGPAEAQSLFANPADLIFRDGKVWIPVEVTERSKTFLDAWQEGAKEWRENLEKNQVGFDQLRSAWNTYAAVDLSSTAPAPALPDAARLLRDFQSDVQRHVRQQIAPRIAELQAAIGRGEGGVKTINSLGVLYAKYGLLDEAERQFVAALAKEEYVPAIVNLGNLWYRRADMQQAATFYQRALKKAPMDPNVILGLARVSEELEDYATVAVLYGKLKEAAPELAQQFSYLGATSDSSTRASEAFAAQEVMVWDEE